MPNYIQQNAIRLPAILLLLLSAGASAMLTEPQQRAAVKPLSDREHATFRSLERDSQFAEVPHAPRSRCDEVRAPQALTTPGPLLTPMHGQMRIKVSFIIGTDGRVHSPLILESAGATRDRRILQTVRSWRYRPATCNGIPTETEGKVEFSSR